jgi:hypothetical protein
MITMRQALSAASLLLVLATPARAQDPESLIPTPEPSPGFLARFSRAASNLDLLLAEQAGLHTVDMLSTAYATTLGGGAHEGNPWLAPLNGHPTLLAATSGAVDVLQVYVITKMAPRHPKLAHVWAAALVATECWVTINNINAVGELQRRRR